VLEVRARADRRRSIAVPRIAVAALTIGIAASAGPVYADPIRITQGALVGDSFGARLDAASHDGRFTISGAGDSVGGIYVAYQCNFNDECQPGRSLTLDSRWSGSDFQGLARVDGAGYEMSGGNAANAFVSFTGFWSAPAFDGRSTTSIRSPFLFEGVFWYPDSFARHPLMLVGSGIATLGLEWTPFNRWRVANTRYDFTTTATDPTPEPMSLLLLSSGAAVLLARRRFGR
jgi:hypothetical protein